MLRIHSVNQISLMLVRMKRKRGLNSTRVLRIFKSAIYKLQARTPKYLNMPLSKSESTLAMCTQNTWTIAKESGSTSSQNKAILANTLIFLRSSNLNLKKICWCRKQQLGHALKSKPLRDLPVDTKKQWTCLDLSKIVASVK